MIESNVKRMSAWVVVLAAIVCTELCALPAKAQVIDLPPQIVQKAGSLGPDEVATVSEWVNKNSANLTNAKAPLLLSADRAAILKPLLDPASSVSFRIELGKLLMPKLQPMINHQDPLVKLNAIIISGDLATGDSLNLIISALDSKDAAIRYEAAFALRRLLGVAKIETAAITTDQVTRAVTNLEARIAKEADPIVVGALIRAALAAAEMPEQRQRAVGLVSRSVRQIAAAQGKEAVSPKLAEAFVIAATGVRDILNAAKPADFDNATKKDAAAMGGHLIAQTVRVVDAQGLPRDNAAANPDLRAVYAQAAGAGWSLAQLSGTHLDPRWQPPVNIDLAKSLLQRNNDGDTKFRLDAELIIGAPNGDGVLLKDPFGFPRNEFRK